MLTLSRPVEIADHLVVHVRMAALADNTKMTGIEMGGYNITSK